MNARNPLFTSGVSPQEKLELYRIFDAADELAPEIDAGEVAQELDNQITLALANKCKGLITGIQLQHRTLKPVEVPVAVPHVVMDALNYDNVFDALIEVLALPSAATFEQHQTAIKALRDGIRAQYVNTYLTDVVEARERDGGGL